MSVASVRSRLVAVFFTTTVAPGIGAPLGSLTVPSMTPVVAWDWATERAGTQSSSATASTLAKRPERIIQLPP